MSDHDHSHAGTFVPHVLPLKIYFGVGIGLFVLTALTVAVALHDLGGTTNLVIALLIATIKGSLVAMFFMHLLYDNKLYLLTFLGALLFLSIFIVFTLFDTQRRGDLYEYRVEQREHPMIEGLRNRPPAAAHEAEGAAEPAASQAAGQNAAQRDSLGAEPAATKESGAPSPAAEASGQAEPAPAH